MIVRGHKITEFGENEAEMLIGKDIVACQIAEGGAMGYHGGVFLVSSSGEIFFTCLLEPSDYSGNRKHTPSHILADYFPPLKEFECGLLGRGVISPNGFKHEYLGMGNHLLVKDSIYQEFQELASVSLKEHPEDILYNLWMDIVCDILNNTLDMKPLSKEELVARLRAIAADETPREEHYGAMCYSQMAPPTKKATCDLCKKEFEYSGWNEDKRIKSVVKEMTKLGYDVKVETICRSCAEDLKAQLHPNEPDFWTAYKEGKKCHVSVCDINFLFSFRTSPDVEYHRAIANNDDYYASLLSLFKNSQMYFDNYDRNHYIADERDVLQFMTGIDFNE